MKRESLLEVLSTVDPAVASNDLIPVLTHYWFTGKAVMAYNDVVAISVPFKSEFKGAIRASLLSGVLSKYDGEDVSFTSEEGNVLIKSGRSRMRVPLMPTDSFLFTFPKVDGDEATLSLTRKSKHAMVRALDICLQSLSRRVSEPQRLGVTVIPSKEKLKFYSTDSVTLSAATVSSKNHKFTDHVTLSKSFCEITLKLLQRTDVEGATLHIDKEYALMTFSDEVILYGRLVDDPNPPKFESIVESYLPKRTENAMVGIPKELNVALDRAYLVVHKALEPVTRIKVVEGDGDKMTLRIIAKSEHGDVTESVEIGGHPETSIKIDLARFRECDLTKFDKMMFDPKCIVLASGSDMYHLIAVQGK